MNPNLRKLYGALLLCLTIPSAYLLLCAPIVGGNAGLWVMDQAIEMHSRLLLSAGALLVMVGAFAGLYVGCIPLVLVGFGGLECFGVKTPLSDDTAASG